MSTPPNEYLQVMQELRKRAESAESALKEDKKTLRYNLIGTIASVSVMAISASIVLSKYPMDRYIHTDNAKAFCDAQTQGEPLITLNTVTEFAKDCALSIDDFSHDNAIEKLNKMAAQCLTPSFRESFFKAPWLAQRVETVQNGLLRVHSQTTGPVLVQSSGMTPNGYMWRVQIPVKRYFKQGESAKGSNERVYIADVYRTTKDAFNPHALAIHAINEMHRSN